jgi:hypothetical protein
VKYRKQVFKLYIAINYLAFLLLAFLLSETVDLTGKSGLAIKDQYVGWLLVSVLITTALYMFKNKVKAHIKRSF